MKINNIDYKSGHILITWYPNSENPQTLNHLIPEVLREQPDMSSEAIKNLLELERPEPFRPMYASVDQLPQGLTKLMGNNLLLSDRIEEIKNLLMENDFSSIRSLRAVAGNTATDLDRSKLEELEAQAQALREELAVLERSNLE